MIKVTIFMKEGVTVGFESTGHAPGASAGNNLICAAMSTIAFGTYYYIKYTTNAKCHAVIKDNAHIVKLLKPHHDAEVALEIFREEMEMLAADSKESFDIFYKEVG